MQMSGIMTTGAFRRWPMSVCLVAGVFVAIAQSGVANADAPVLFGDLGPFSPEKLTKEQLDQLLPGATMRRIVPSTGSTHIWTNNADGTMVVSSDNKSGINSSITNRSGVTATGTWHISPEGRYCVTVNWKRVDPEDWCRYLFKTSEGYFVSKTENNRAEKVYRMWINGN